MPVWAGPGPLLSAPGAAMQSMSHWKDFPHFSSFHTGYSGHRPTHTPRAGRPQGTDAGRLPALAAPRKRPDSCWALPGPAVVSPGAGGGSPGEGGPQPSIGPRWTPGTPYVPGPLLCPRGRGLGVGVGDPGRGPRPLPCSPPARSRTGWADSGRERQLSLSPSLPRA